MIGIIALAEDSVRHISSGVEYALHCLLHLTGEPVGVVEASVRDLAEMQGLSFEYVAKLFTKLRKAGLAIATEGAHGGFRLARESRKISVLDVVLAIDGNKPLFECKEVRVRCAIFGDSAPKWAAKGVCSIHAVMLEAERQMRDALATSTLADLAQQVAVKAPSSYGGQVVAWFRDRSPAR